MLPIPAARKSTPRSAIFLHSLGSAISPAPITPSSSPPIEPTSASIERPFSWQTFTSSDVFAIFSSIGNRQTLLMRNLPRYTCSSLRMFRGQDEEQQEQ